MTDQVNDDYLVPPGATGDEAIILEAKARFRRVKAWESEADSRWVDDTRFAWADPDNGWQWPGYLWSQRRDDAAGYTPKLTINEIRVRNNQIINDAKQNKPGVNIRPVGNDASFKAAQVWQLLIKHIERNSMAEQAYDTAFAHAVDGGIGYIRLKTEYVDNKSFDQEIKIERVKNPLLVKMDCDANEIDKSDSNYAFVFEDQVKAEFYHEHPELRGKIGVASAVSGDYDYTWISSDKVRKAEYFRRKMVKDELLLLAMPVPGVPRVDWQEGIARRSLIRPDLWEIIQEEKTIRNRRDIWDHKIEHFKIAGDVIYEKGEWPGRYIPLIPVIGNEVVIEGQLDRKGHTRWMKDAQRMYNFWASSAVEYVALGTKARWFIPVGATENLESYFATINRQNYSFIPYNAVNENGDPLPAPTPIEPPQMGEGYIKGMVIARDQLMMSSGQYQAQMGQNENAKSGVAIAERQRQGDNATYQYIDNEAIAIRRVGAIILDVAPHVYDTKQIKRILADDGSEMLIQFNPDQEEAYKEEQISEDEIRITFNPQIGQYWVEPDVGPSFATKRQEAWNAFVQITSQNKELVTVIGDLMFRNADFPGALEIAKRLRRLVPQQALDGGPSPDLQQALEQNKGLTQLLADATQSVAELKLKLLDKTNEQSNRERELDIREQEAEAKMLKEVGNSESNLANIDPEAFKEVVHNTLMEALKNMGLPVPKSLAGGSGGIPQGEGPESAELASAPDLNAAQPGSDGEMYVPDPARPGQHLRMQKGNGSVDLVPVEGAPVQGAPEGAPVQ